MKMKNEILVAVLLCLFGTQWAFAQEESGADEPQVQYLLGNKDYDFGGFGAPSVMFTTIEGDFAVLTGGQGAALVNKRFFFGGFGHGLATQHSRIIENVKYRTELGYGGLWMGYNIAPDRLVHPVISVKGGIGGLSLSEGFWDDDNTRPENWDNKVYNDLIFALIPAVGMEMNITNWFKISGHAGYHLIADVDKARFDADDYNAPFVSVSFSFGGFD